MCRAQSYRFPFGGAKPGRREDLGCSLGEVSSKFGKGLLGCREGVVEGRRLEEVKDRSRKIVVGEVVNLASSCWPGLHFTFRFCTRLSRQRAEIASCNI